MTREKNSALLALLALSIFLTAGPAWAQKAGPKPSAPGVPSFFGLIPRPSTWADPPVSRKLGILDAPPSAWDWRAHGGVTPIRDQNPYGACWSFAVLGAIESQGMVRESTSRNFAEFNLINCNPWGTTCNTGGNDFFSIGYLARAGTVLEADDLYSQCPSTTCNSGKPRVVYPLDWQTLANNTTEIKDALYHTGPVYTTMYASGGGFASLAAGAVYYYTGTNAADHSVLIVGYDDNKSHAGGKGAWLIKNSWGTWWSDSGYGWIAYGSARIGEGSSSFGSYRRHSADEVVRYYDEKGADGYLGWDRDDWGMVRYVPANTGWLTRVAFWTTDVNTTYRVRVYDNFSGSVLSTLLASVNGSAPKKGYYTVTLSPPIKVTAANEVFLAVGWTVPTAYPIPLDMSGTPETNKTYISNTGASWSAYNSYDVAIRGHFLKDADYDLVTDSLETGACWKPADPDSDDDGLCDGNVNVVSGATTVCVAGEDFDADGVLDANEPSPCDSDSDDDLMPDKFEVVNGGACGLNPRAADANADPDADCITNRNEYLGSTNPCVANPPGCVLDTDGDGLNDNVESALGTNPNDPDSDDDGNFDGNEYWNGSNPLALDRTGFADCGYWGEGDGDGFISPADESILASAINDNLDYSFVYPANGETHDLDADTFLSPADGSIIAAMIHSFVIDLLPSRPDLIERVSPAAGVTPTRAVGDTLGITVAVHNTGGLHTAGIPVVFTVGTSTGSATLWGGDGADEAGSRYDLSGVRAGGGQARIVVRFTAAGSVTINARINQCGLGGAGRYSAMINLASPVTVTVTP